MGIYSIKIQNFKSIRETDEIRLTNLNVLIGPNGAGKSNFISFFKFLNKLYDQQLQLYISRHGRADNFLHFGRKKSLSLGGTITFTNDWRNQYAFAMVPDQAGNLLFAEEWSNYTKPTESQSWSHVPNTKQINIPGRPESVLKDDEGARAQYLRTYFESLKIFHFHDTSFNSRVKGPCGATDYSFLYEDGGNLAAFLYRLQQANPKNFKIIEGVVKGIAPFFDKFFLTPDEVNPQQIYLRWLERGSDQIFNAHNLSDGTLRMMCLAALLLQPELPSTIIIDEPELGLHPFAIVKLAAMIKSASVNTQIIISTQSVNLLDQFDADDVIVVERENNQSVFKRQSNESLKEWLNDYSIGELWDKNVIGGTP